MKSIAITNLEKITEEQYLRREFGITTKYGCLDQKYVDTYEIVITDRPDKWKTLLSTAPRSSLIFILIGNETYEPWKYEFFNSFDSVLHLFIYNPPNTCPRRNAYKSLFGHLLDGGLISTGAPGSVFRDFRTAQFTRKKLAKIEIRQPFTELPQGYSNSFVDQLRIVSPRIERYLESQESLFTQQFNAIVQPFISKVNTFSYLAQWSNHRRAVCARVANEVFGVEIRSKNTFGGLNFDGDRTYIDLLLSTKYPLVPPGNFNNYNHRYTEALLTGGIPVILAQNSLDPSNNHNWSSDLSFPKGHSYRLLMKFLSELSEKERSELQKKALWEDLKRTESVQHSLNSLIR